MNTMSIAAADRALTVIENVVSALEAATPAAPSALATAKQAVVQVAMRNPVAAYVAAGAVIGIGGTVLAINYGPKAIRLARASASRAIAWAGRKMTRAALPAAPAQSVEGDAAPAAA